MPALNRRKSGLSLFPPPPSICSPIRGRSAACPEKISFKFFSTSLRSFEYFAKISSRLVSRSRAFTNTLLFHLLQTLYFTGFEDTHFGNYSSNVAVWCNVESRVPHSHALGSYPHISP